MQQNVTRLIVPIRSYHEEASDRLLLLDFNNQIARIPVASKNKMDANQILDREFLEIRSRILDVASSLDRIQRADGDVSSDPRMRKLTEALQIVLMQDPHRAEKIQLLFSREYDEHWKDEFSLPSAN